MCGCYGVRAVLSARAGACAFVLLLPVFVALFLLFDHHSQHPDSAIGQGVRSFSLLVHQATFIHGALQGFAYLRGFAASDVKATGFHLRFECNKAFIQVESRGFTRPFDVIRDFLTTRRKDSKNVIDLLGELAHHLVNRISSGRMHDDQTGFGAHP